MDGSTTTELNLAWCLAVAGRPEDAQKILDHIKERAGSEHVSPAVMGYVEFALGRADEGLKLLEQGVKERGDEKFSMAIDPWFEKFRNGPRWKRTDQAIRSRPGSEGANPG
jgi:hypothetical protein